jgi:hypothetical protein
MGPVQKKKLILIVILMFLFIIILFVVKKTIPSGQAIAGKVYYVDSGWECNGETCICFYHGCTLEGKKENIGYKIKDPGHDPAILENVNITKKPLLCGFFCRIFRYFS